SLLCTRWDASTSRRVFSLHDLMPRKSGQSGTRRLVLGAGGMGTVLRLRSKLSRALGITTSRGFLLPRLADKSMAVSSPDRTHSRTRRMSTAYRAATSRSVNGTAYPATGLVSRLAADMFGLPAYVAVNRIGAGESDFHAVVFTELVQRRSLQG